MNRITLTGNLTRNPQCAITPAGIPVCNFTIAVNRRKRVAGKIDRYATQYFRVTTWRGLADLCAKHLTKGRSVTVTGELTADAYIGNDSLPHISLDVNADEVEFMGGHVNIDLSHSDSDDIISQESFDRLESHTQEDPLPVTIEDSDLPF